MTREVVKGLSQMRAQIEHAGGCIEGERFVTRVGMQPIAETALLKEGKGLCDLMNVGASSGTYAGQLAELFSRQTYLAFPNEPQNEAAYLDRVINKAGHRSVTKGSVVVHHIAGLSVAGVIDLIRHGGDIARLTTSKTKAMNETMYRLMGSDSERELQRKFTEDFLSMRADIEQKFNPRKLSKNGDELFNVFNLQTKTLVLFHSMNLKQLYSLLKTTLVKGDAEAELRELCIDVIEKLHARNPMIIPQSTELLRAERVREEYSDNFLEDKILQGVGMVSEGIFVEKPGCRVSFPSLGLLTSYQREKNDPRMISVQFELTGVAFETLLELVAHDEAVLADFRLDFPTTNGFAMYRIQGSADEHEWQKQGVLNFLDLKKKFNCKYSELSEKTVEGEYGARHFELGSRATAVKFGMTLADYHKLFIGRLSHHGNEQEIQEVCGLMCDTLHEFFPDQILSREEYYELANEAKY